jgi:DNA-binding LacI/PurR family transcriptional regulator
VGILFSIDEIWAFIWAFIRPIIDEIESSLRHDDRNTILIPIRRNSTVEEILSKVVQSRTEAVISLHYGNDRLFETLEDLDIPIIVVMNNNYQDRFYSVLVDDIQCAYEGTRHLISLGHERLAYVECERPDLPVLTNDRFFGFRKAIEEAGIQVPEQRVLRFDLNDIATLTARLERWFSEPRNQWPTGIFCLDDDIGVRVISVLRSLGVRVPDDVSLVAPGDVLDYSQNHIPKITTMRINTAYMGKIVYQMLVNRLEQKPEDLHVLKVIHQLVRRDTTQEPPQDQGA